MGALLNALASCDIPSLYGVSRHESKKTDSG